MRDGHGVEMLTAPMLTLLPLFLAQWTPVPPGLAHDYFGASVESAGDVDADGVPDLWVGDPSQFTAGEPARGSVWCVSGKDGTTLLRIQAPTGVRDFGWTLAGLGDVDGDGVRDVAVGCLDAEERAAEQTSGQMQGPPLGVRAVYLFSGSDGAQKWRLRGAPDMTKIDWLSSQSNPALAVVGDWNEDGADDLAIGWSHANSKETEEGRVEVVSGRDGTTIHEWRGLEAFDRFGYSLERLPDLDGDGCCELAASAVPNHASSPYATEAKRRTRAGYVRILSSTGSVVRTLRPDDESPSFGYCLALAPGADKESAHELIVGQPYDRKSSYVITRWSLADGGVVQRMKRPPQEEWDGGWMRRNTQPRPDAVDESFATCVLAIPDRDGDGKWDLLVTEPQFFCFVPAGVLSSKPSEVEQSVPIGRVELGKIGIEYAHVGIGVCSAGDLDADGVDDIALSGCSVAGSNCTGCVVLVSGKTLQVLRAFSRAGRE